MADELPTRLDAETLRAIEADAYTTWERAGVFQPQGNGTPYVVVIPPPNVTGILHMGHALNETLQDICVRHHRMRGDRTLWIPGTDHAGIATQHVVEESLAKAGKDRKTMGRDAFLEAVWQWKEKYGGIILSQIRRLGSSVDWTRCRFTMDAGLSRAVREVFVRLYEKGLIYRGSYIVNWCPNDQTALSDDEVEHVDEQGHLWHLRYPIVGEDKKYVVVATTRPETMLGDTAVAVHPDDERYQRLHGAKVRLPLVDREIPVVTDTAVDPKFGTGAVKVTPGHDPNDFEIGQRHKLPVLRIMNPDGTLNETAGRFAGLDRAVAREQVVQALQAAGLLERVEPHGHAVGHCYRCNARIEPFVSEQWFVRMKPLAQSAARATRDGRVRFFPARWERIYLSWLENVRDWCISRQIWWGHRIPVWYCADCPHLTVAATDPRACAGCGGERLRQDEDVLDTWFSSALWPMSTLGWPDKTSDLAAFYPTTTLVTDRGIIYFWVARMVMMGLECMGAPPFSDVVIHGTILDDLGRKMSKSLGNGIDPIQMIERYGADAVRFTLADLTTEGQDVKLAETRFEKGRNFATKILNAARFTVTVAGAGDEPAAPGPAALEDRWILSRLAGAAGEVAAALHQYRFNEAAGTLFRAFWDELCAVYLELVKARLRTPGPDRARARATLANAMGVSLRLLHPMMPHLTERLWQALGGMREAKAAGVRGLCAMAPWPADGGTDAEAERVMAAALDVVRAVRNIRKQHKIADGQVVKVVVSATDPADLPVLQAGATLIQRLANASAVTAGHALPKPAGSAADVVGTLQVYVPIEGLIDKGAEKERLDKAYTKKHEQLLDMRRKLENEAFLRNAPREVVENLRKSLRGAEDELERIRRNLADLG